MSANTNSTLVTETSLITRQCAICRRNLTRADSMNLGYGPECKVLASSLLAASFVAVPERIDFLFALALSGAADTDSVFTPFGADVCNTAAEAGLSLLDVKAGTNARQHNDLAAKLIYLHSFSLPESILGSIVEALHGLGMTTLALIVAGGVRSPATARFDWNQTSGRTKPALVVDGAKDAKAGEEFTALGAIFAGVDGDKKAYRTPPQAWQAWTEIALRRYPMITGIAEAVAKAKAYVSALVCSTLGDALIAVAAISIPDREAEKKTLVTASATLRTLADLYESDPEGTLSLVSTAYGYAETLTEKRPSEELMGAAQLRAMASLLSAEASAIPSLLSAMPLPPRCSLTPSRPGWIRVATPYHQRVVDAVFALPRGDKEAFDRTTRTYEVKAMHEPTLRRVILAAFASLAA